VTESRKGLAESSTSFGAKVSPAIRAFFLVSAISGLFGGVPAQAAWPERTLTIIVPFPPGGPNDLLGRLLAAELGRKLGQTVVIENKVGANGDIGIAAGAHAQPDGYTLTEVTGVILINPSVRKTAYDPAKDFAPIAYLGAAPNAIITRPATGINNVTDLVAKAKAASGKLTYATAGTGSVSQLAVELLKLRTDIDMTHVPFQGAAPSLQAALSGTTDIAAVSIAGLVGHIKSGALNALVQTGRERWPDLPDVPTMAEAGIPNAVIETSQMLLAPASTPEAVIRRLAEATREVLQKPEVQEKMANAGFRVQYEGPQELQTRILRELPFWKELVDRAGLATAK
jgi:tripartite-type tricarboxylate transporter receptor subunit TctC